jgi:hypothetical protein
MFGWVSAAQWPEAVCQNSFISSKQEDSGWSLVSYSCSYFSSVAPGKKKNKNKIMKKRMVAAALA